MAAAVSPTDHQHDLSVFPDGLKGKRVLLCTESFGPVNGVSRTTLMLVNHLRANGCNVAVVAPHNSTKVNTFIPTLSSAPPQQLQQQQQQQQPTTATISDDDGHSNIEVRLHGYPVPFNPELSIAYLVRLSALYARTFGTAPDLIYLASPASLGFQVMLQLRQRPPRDQVPVICNFQTDLAGYCKTLFPYPLGDLADYAFATVQSFLFRHPSVKTIFYPSTYVRRYLARHHVPLDKTALLTRGVDAQLFHPAKRSAALRRQLVPAAAADGTGGASERSPLVLLCVARLAAEKSFDFLALVARALDARGLEFCLYIVGGNRQVEVEAEIKALFADLEARGKVVFAGFRVGEALAEAYASADLFLHCSVSETFGLVVLESFASGVPVVARDLGGPSDTVRDGVSGFLTPPDDLDMFVDRVVELANDGAKRGRFAEAALRQAREATWDKINNKVAWRMLDTIREREADVAEMDLEGPRADGGGVLSAVPVFGWMMLSKAFRETVVSSRLTAALGVICGFWGLVSVYLVFTKATRWVRGIFSRYSA